MSEYNFPLRDRRVVAEGTGAHARGHHDRALLVWTGAVPLGARVRVSLAMGSSTLHKDASQAVAFRAGGIGVTPMRRIIKWALEEGLTHRSRGPSWRPRTHRNAHGGARDRGETSLHFEIAPFELISGLPTSVNGPNSPSCESRAIVRPILRRSCPTL